MYLTRIDPHTNLIDLKNTQDGILSIKAFADIINNKELGVQCMTCIALSVDYASPMRKYPMLERPAAAMRFVTGDVKAFAWNQNVVMEACDVYEQLQFNADLEEISIIKQMRLEKLAELKETNDISERSSVLREIEKIKAMERRYTDEDENRLIDESEAKKNNYRLSRLEQKLKNKNTFYHVRRKKQRELEQRRAERESKSESRNEANSGNEFI